MNILDTSVKVGRLYITATVNGEKFKFQAFNEEQSIMNLPESEDYFGSLNVKDVLSQFEGLVNVNKGSRQKLKGFNTVVRCLKSNSIITIYVRVKKDMLYFIAASDNKEEYAVATFDKKTGKTSLVINSVSSLS